MNAPVKHKLNHSYIWLGALRTVPYIFVVVLASAGESLFELADYLTSEGTILVALLIILVAIIVVTGIVMLFRLLFYRFIWYEYSNDEFSYYSGIISKKRVHIPYQRIQSINQKASLFQRIAGVCTVSIETAGGASNKAVTLPYIEKSAAEALRKELFARKQLAQMKQAGVAIPEGVTLEDLAASSATATNASPTNSSAPTNASGQTVPAPTGAPVTSIPAPAGSPVAGIPAPAATATAMQAHPVHGNALDTPAQIVNDFRGVFGGDAIDTGAVSYEYGLSNKQLVLAAMTNKTSFFVVLGSLIATIASLISGVGYVFNTTEDEIVSSLASLIALVPSSFIVGAIASVVGFVIVVMLVIWLIMVAGTCISYGGFRARRRGARIETEYGIINHNFSGIDIERIQSVEISQSFFQRLLKSCTLSLARVASSSQDSSDSGPNNQAKLIIHPFVKLDKVDSILEGLLPEWNDLPVAAKKLPARSLRRAITRRAILQGGGFWLAVVTFISMYFISLPLQADLFSPAEQSDYLAFYLIADIVARVLYVFALLLFIVEIVDAVLWQRASGFGYDQRYVTINNSGFSTDRTITPRTKVQLATLRTNPLQRHKKLTTIIALTAAGVGSSQLRLIDVDEADAAAWFAWCHPGGNKLQPSVESSAAQMQ